MSGTVHTGVEVHRMDSEMSKLVKQPWLQLGFSLCAAPSVCHMVATSDIGKKSKIGVSAE